MCILQCSLTVVGFCRLPFQLPQTTRKGPRNAGGAVAQLFGACPRLCCKAQLSNSCEGGCPRRRRCRCWRACCTARRACSALRAPRTSAPLRSRPSPPSRCPTPGSPPSTAASGGHANPNSDPLAECLLLLHSPVRVVGDVNNISTASMSAEHNGSGCLRRCRGVQLGNFSYVEEPLGLGAAGGNQFDIVLRGVAGASPEQVPPSCDCMVHMQQKAAASTCAWHATCCVRKKMHLIL